VGQTDIAGLYLEAAPLLRRHARSFTHDPELANDAVQEAFLRLLEAAHGGLPIANPRAWLFRTVHNYLVDHSRSKTAQTAPLPEPFLVADLRPDQEAACIGRELVALARQILGPREAECVRLSAAGYTYREIGEALGIHRGSVGGAITRAAVKLRAAAVIR
jgi:RNA polymerase sigma-70 factor (ECF subfamily)